MRVETVGGTGAQENVVFLRRRKEFCAERIGQGPYCTFFILILSIEHEDRANIIHSSDASLPGSEVSSSEQGVIPSPLAKDAEHICPARLQVQGRDVRRATAGVGGIGPGG